MAAFIRRLLYSALLTVCFLNARAQGEANVWVFGDHAGFDFNSGVPVPIATSIYTIEGSASVCNAAGQLLFYTEGSTLWDRNGNPTPNGKNITGLSTPTYSPTASTTQSSLFVPMPDSPGKYFLFSLTDGTISSVHNLYYSVIDLSLNNGLGDIVPGRKGIVLDSMLSEKLTGVVGKCCNIWVVVNKGDGHFHAFQITGAGLNTTPVSSPSGINNGFSYNFGEIKFSPDGNKMAAGSQSFFGVKLYDFDGYTGVFSNILTLKNRDFYGVCFSPDNSKLYAASDSVFQYDLSLSSHAAIMASEKKIAKTGNLTNAKLGPDGKVYFQGVAGVSVVDFPNLAGVACHVRPNAITMLPGTFMQYGGMANVVPVLHHDTAAFTRRDTAVCFRDSIQLMVPSPGCDYIWEDGSTDPIHTVKQDGKYVIRYITPPCVFHSDTIAVDFAAAIPSTGFYSGCGQAGTGYLYVLPGAGDHFPYTYTWRDSSGNQLQQHTSTLGDTLFALNPGKYTVRMNGNGCDTILKLTLIPPQNIRASFATDTIICIGDTSHFINTSNGFSAYLWLFGDGNTATQVNPVHYYQHPGTYHVALIGYPCGDTAKKTIIVDSTSSISFTTDKDHFCEGATVAFHAVYHEGISRLLWDFGDGGATVQGFSPQHAYDIAGQYTIKVTAQYRACPDTSFTDSISVYGYPTVNLGTDTFMCNTSNPLPLTNLAMELPFYRHLWSTGDTSATTLAKVPGTYFLTVTNEHDCGTTDTIEVRRSCYINIPNAFSPNDDGSNDYFFPREILSHAVATFHMQLFNRWGEKIFETDNVNGRGWDGKLNGKPQPTGVYVYLIEVRFANNIEEKYQGNVTLLR